MYTTIVFVNDEMEELEDYTLEGVSMKEAIDMVDKASEFRLGYDGLLHEKDSWLALDFQNNKVEVMVKDLR